MLTVWLFLWSFPELFRETSESGDTAVRQQQKTLLSQLSNCDEEEITNAIDGTKGIKSVEVRPNPFEYMNLSFTAPFVSSIKTLT